GESTRRVTRINPFLQNWDLKTSVLPPCLRALVKVAKKYNLRLEGLAFSREILRTMPMWKHKYLDTSAARTKRLAPNSCAYKCLRDQHNALTVGDFADLAATRDSLNHIQSASCNCGECASVRARTACGNPDRCYKKAREFVMALPDKWNPLTFQPEDTEDFTHDSFVAEQALYGENLTAFDTRVTVRGDIGQAFRIFTSGDICNSPPVTQIDEQTHDAVTIATDGSCIRNGEADTRAGAGTFVEDGHALNRAIRLPEHIEQSNQAGEAVAILLASQIAD
ncbi:hypothetical protein C8Q80DRAFT_1081185, partial [Daedaleopsis nitida]